MTTSDERDAPSVLPCRLVAILAREAPRAVILRRGPSKWVQTILWHTDDDTFTYRQWFHGRIYEDRCDISPDGDLFLYFASKITGRTLRDGEYTHAWTAISKPPYLTALALWPKGDTWGGGGRFGARWTVLLAHGPGQMTPHPAHRPRGLKVLPLSAARMTAATAEGCPLPTDRTLLPGGGWQVVKKGVWPPFRLSARRRRWEAERPTVWEKPQREGRYHLRWALRAYDFDQTGGSEVSDYALHKGDPCTQTPLTGANWADWDQRGRLVFAREGRLYATVSGAPTGTAVMLADFNDQRPYTLATPAWAREW